MFCPKCGAANSDGAAFCKNCGSPLGAAAQPAAPAPAAPVYSAPAAPDTPAVAALKKVASSPLTLIAAIAYSAAMLFSWIFNASGGIERFLYQVFGSDLNRFLRGLDLPISYGYSSWTIGAIIGSIVGSAPSVLVVIGFWLLFAAGRKPGPMKTAGFTLIKVTLVIGLVCVCIAAGVGFIVMLVGMFMGSAFLGSSSYGGYGFESVAFSGLMLITLLIFAGVITLVILFLSKAIKSVNTAKNTALTGVASDRVSPFVAVMCFIAVASLAIYAIISLVTLQFLAFFSLAANAAFVVCCGCLIFKYRSAQRAVMASAPAYAAPVYAAPAQPAPVQAAPAPAPAQAAPAPQAAPAQIVCSSCGTAYDPEYAFCPNCGTPKH